LPLQLLIVEINLSIGVYNNQNSLILGGFKHHYLLVFQKIY